MIDHLLALWAGFGIGYAITALVLAFDSSLWRKQAAKSDIALPAHLERRIARLLRASTCSASPCRRCSSRRWHP